MSGQMEASSNRERAEGGTSSENQLRSILESLMSGQAVTKMEASRKRERAEGGTSSESEIDSEDRERAEGGTSSESEIDPVDRERAEGGTSSESEIDYEDLPVLEIGKKRPIKITTYVELHSFVVELVTILEEVFELGILKGTAKRCKPN